MRWTSGSTILETRQWNWRRRLADSGRAAHYGSHICSMSRRRCYGTRSSSREGSDSYKASTFALDDRGREYGGDETNAATARREHANFFIELNAAMPGSRLGQRMKLMMKVVAALGRGNERPKRRSGEGKRFSWAVFSVVDVSYSHMQFKWIQGRNAV
jgi:hypothetical protein